MSDLRSLESFLKSVEAGSFSAAASLLGLTPAAVSKHVAKLEQQLGTRLFQRSTRHLALTEAGELLYAETAGPARSLAVTLATLAERDAQPAGTLRISMGPGFARQYVLPLMPAFVELYPRLQLDWSLENRRVDLIRENYDAAIGSGVEADANVVARQLAPLKLVVVASPAYLARHGTPETVEDLSRHDCIRLRSATTGRLINWDFSMGAETVTAQVGGRLILSDFETILDAALAGMGIALLGAHHVLPFLDSGQLVPVLPRLATTQGAIHIYYTRARRTPAKVRAFVDFLTDAFSRNEYIKRVWALSAAK